MSSLFKKIGEKKNKTNRKMYLRKQEKNSKDKSKQARWQEQKIKGTINRIIKTKQQRETSPKFLL